jgi:hypothetical protein
LRSFISEHRFRLMLGVCAGAPILMLGTIYLTTGFNLARAASSAAPTAGEDLLAPRRAADMAPDATRSSGG